MFYFASDPHGRFDQIIKFSQDHWLTPNDTIVILGDACFNHYRNKKDDVLKQFVATMLDCKVLVVRGNHDTRPNLISSYETDKFCSGEVYVEAKYPNLLFAKDGELYNLDGVKSFVIGGAKTINDELHILQGHPIQKDSDLLEKEKQDIEEKLDNIGWNVDLMLTHSCPQSFIKPEMLYSGYDQSQIDRSLEIWMDEIEKRLNYKYWLFGHFHIDLTISDTARCIKNDIFPLSDTKVC